MTLRSEGDMVQQDTTKMSCLCRYTDDYFPGWDDCYRRQDYTESHESISMISDESARSTSSGSM